MNEVSQSQIIQLLYNAFVASQQINMPTTVHNMEAMQAIQSNVKAVVEVLQEQQKKLEINKENNKYKANKAIENANKAVM